MRVLGIDTTTHRGSVALVENGSLVLRGAHMEPNAHAERLLPLVDEVLAGAGWAPASIDRVGVGVGPGSFTGVRVGMALAQGFALGLGVPVLGVPSLTAMARAVPPAMAGRRLACLDARRGELFVAASLPDGSSGNPEVLERGRIVDFIRNFSALGPLVLVGGVLGDFEADLAALVQNSAGRSDLAEVRWYRSDDADLPDARWVAEIASSEAGTVPAVEPLYVRSADATLPALAPDRLVRELSVLSPAANPGDGA